MALFGYLSNQVFSVEGSKSTVVSWDNATNLIAWGQENGHIIIAKVDNENNKSGLPSINTTHTLVNHKSAITALVWNTRYNKLVSGDKNGKFLIWVEVETKWIPYMINDNIPSPIAAISLSPYNDAIAIAYENGRFICGDINGNPKWKTVVNFKTNKMAWNESSRYILVADSSNQIFALKARGTKTELKYTGIMEIDFENDKIVDMARTEGVGGYLIIAFQSGKVIITHNDDIPNSVVYDLDLKISAAAWSANGSMFAVAGHLDNGQLVIKLYSHTATQLRMIKIEGNSITSISFRRNGRQIAVALDHSLALIQIIPRIPAGLFNNTFIYGIQNDRTKFSVIYTHIKTGETHAKTIDHLVNIAVSKKFIVLVSSYKKDTNILITNEKGIPVNSNSIQLETKFVAASDSFVVISSESKLCYWEPQTNKVSFKLFDADITSIAASQEYILVSLSDNSIISLDLEMNEIANYQIACHVESMVVSCDGTRIAFMDPSGRLFFIDVHSGQPVEQTKVEACSIVCASDTPDMLAVLSKRRTLIFRDFEVIEPISSMTKIHQFSDLKLFCADISRLLNDPFHPNPSIFIEYETKPLRDFKLLLKSYKPELKDEIIAHARYINHPAVFKLLGDFAMEQKMYTVAKQAFSLGHCQEGLRTVEVVMRSDRSFAYGIVLAYLGRLDEAVKIMEEANRHDMANRILSERGFWDLVDPNPQISHALGVTSYIKGDWSEAAKHFADSGDIKQQIDSLASMGETDEIIRVMNNLPHGSPLLEYIGKCFVSLGNSEQATAAFMKLGSPQLAVNALVHANKWTEALNLGNKYAGEVNRHQLMKEFAAHLTDNQHFSRAIKTLVRCKLNDDASKLIEMEGDKMISQRQYVMAKKCYVIAAKFSSKPNWRKAEAVHFMLLSHRLLFAERYEEALYPAALVLHVYKDIVGTERAGAILALAGFHSGFLEQCSIGLSFLEHSPNLKEKKKAAAENIAFGIFSKEEPKDPKNEKFICRKCGKENSVFKPLCRCGELGYVSAVTGRVINGRFATCRCCHRFFSPEDSVRVCPLCHCKCSI